MPEEEKRRKADQRAWMRQVWTGVVTACILGVIVWAVNMPTIYATQEDLKEQETKCDSSSQKVEAKMDRLIQLSTETNASLKEQAIHIEYIKQSLSSEIERSKEADRKLADRIERR